MGIAIPLTLETVRLVLEILPEKYDGTPEDLYDFFYNKKSYTHIYIPSNGRYYFEAEAALTDCQYALVTIEEARKKLFIISLET